MPQEFHVLASRGYRKRKLILVELRFQPQQRDSRHSQSYFVKRSFSEPWWFYSCLKSQKTIPDYYFNNNNCYNRTSVHIIRTVILNCHLTHGWLLKVKESVIQRCGIWSLTKVCHWKCMEFIVCYFLVALENQILYIKCAFASWIDWWKFHIDST